MTDRTSVSERNVAFLLEQVGRAAFGDGFSGGLNPAQWAALRYFGRANRFSRAVSAFAEFQGTTRGTASQTVKSLVKKGYLTREPAPGDRRSFRLELTAEGRRLLEDDPFQELAGIAGSLTPAQRSNLAQGLDIILDRILTRRGQPRFGVCACCCHLRLDACRGHPLGPHECGLLSEPLGEPEIGEICAMYSGARFE